MTKHKHYYVIRAYADGWKIELKEYEHWVAVTHPGFVENREYRVILDENGWLPWYGGSECPVDPDTMVEARYSGNSLLGQTRLAKFFNWGAGGIYPVAAYRVIAEEKVDPYAALKAAAKDPTKQIKDTHPRGLTDGWHDSGYDWQFKSPVDNYEIRAKPKKMKLLAYVTPNDGYLTWKKEGVSMPPAWKRAPSEDKEIEVEG